MYRKLTNLNYDANHSVIFSNYGHLTDLESVVRDRMQGIEPLGIKVVDYRLSRTGLSSYYVDVVVDSSVRIHPTYCKWDDNEWITDGIYFPFASHKIDWSLYPVHRDHCLGSRLTIVPRWKDFDPQYQSWGLDEVTVEVYIDDKMERLPVADITGNDVGKNNMIVRYQFNEIPYKSTRRAFRTLKALGVINPDQIDTPIGRRLGICRVDINGVRYNTWDWLHYYTNLCILFEDLNNLFELPGYCWQFERKIVNDRLIGILIRYVDQDFEALGETMNIDGEIVGAISRSPEHYLEDIVRELNI